jgi:hypothetical protein
MIPMRKSILIFVLHSEFAHWRSFGASLDGIGFRILDYSWSSGTEIVINLISPLLRSRLSIN